MFGRRSLISVISNLFLNSDITFKYFSRINIPQRFGDYKSSSGAAVTQPEGERSFVLHTPQPSLMASRGSLVIEGWGHTNFQRILIPFNFNYIIVNDTIIIDTHPAIPLT